LIGGDGDDALWGHGAHGETLDGGAGNDKLVAGGNGDILIGGLGNDWLHGGAGDDTFVFGSNRWGNDVVVNFDLGHDALDFRGPSLQYSDLHQSLSPSGLHTVIGYHGSWLTLANVTNVTATDFIFA
jgi:Ca2+-binding RTX toxin-like protein